MQVQKTEIKNKIISSALDEFSRLGYKGASIRSIAQKAGITPGNIYAYFRSKDELLYFVMSETLEQVKNYVSYLSKGDDYSDDTLRHVAEEITRLFLMNKKQFVILMSNFPSDKLGDFYGSLTKAIAERINEDFLSKIGVSGDMLLSSSLSEGYVSGLMNIFSNYGNDEDRLKKLVNDFTEIMFSTNKTGGTINR